MNNWLTSSIMYARHLFAVYVQGRGGGGEGEGERERDTRGKGSGEEWRERNL